MDIRMKVFDAAAQDLAKFPNADANVQAQICRRHGVFVEELTEDEFVMLEHMAREYYRRRLR